MFLACLVASEVSRGVQITEELYLNLMIQKVFWGPVEMTFRQLHASYSLPEWLAVSKEGTLW